MLFENRIMAMRMKENKHRKSCQTFNVCEHTLMMIKAKVSSKFWNTFMLLTRQPSGWYVLGNDVKSAVKKFKESYHRHQDEFHGGKKVTGTNAPLGAIRNGNGKATWSV